MAIYDKINISKKLSILLIISLGVYMKKFLSIVLSLLMVFSIVSCAKKSTGEVANADSAVANVEEEATGVAQVNTADAGEKIIKIGVFEPQSGQNGGGGKQEVYGIRYANMIYNTITIGGEEYKIVLDEVDNQSNDTEAVSAAQKLVADRVNVVLGSYGSSVSIKAGPHFRKAEIPAIGCSCTNVQVTKGNDYYFRVCYLDPFQGRIMAQYAKKHNYNKVAVITELGDDYSTGLGKSFEDGCKELGIEVVSHHEFQKNEQDFNSILTKIKSANPEFIFAPSSIVTAPLILTQARALNINCQIGAGDTWENGTIITNAGDAANGIVVSTFYEAKSKEEAEGEEAVFLNGVNGDGNGFLEYLKSQDPKEEMIPAVSALGYDSYLAAYKAIEKAGSLEGPAIRDALAELSFTGVTGDISFNSDGDAIKNTAYIKEVSEGQFVFKEKV